MSFANDAQRFGAFARALHWVSAALVLAGLAAIEAADLFGRGSATRELLKLLHFQAGALIFLLTLPRLASRFSQALPAITPTPPAWQAGLAHLTHFALYALLLALPISGVLMRQAAGHAVSILGLGLPTLIGADEATGRWLHALHELLGNGAIGLIAVHALAAVYHHRVSRDDTLLRMLPPR